MIARGLAKGVALALVFAACSSSKTAPPEEILHRTDGDIDVVVRVSTVRPNTLLGKGIAQHGIAMDVRRGKDFLAGPGAHCGFADKKTFDLRLDAARGLLAYRCTPAEAWVLVHVGETALHADCGANGGNAPEPDLAAAKTLLERAPALTKCAVDEKLADTTRDVAMLTLSIDVYRASKSDARTAEVLLDLLDALRAKDGDGHMWPQAVWNTETLRGIKSAERQTLPPSVYPELQRQALARLAKATAPDEIVALASVTDGHDARFADAATNALKIVTALPASGSNDAAIALLLGPMLTTAPDRAAKIGCDALRAGLQSGTAALAAAKSKPACPAIPTTKPPEERCAAPKADALTEFPAQVLDDRWKRKALSDASFHANPHDFVPWQDALDAAACARSR